MLEPPFRFEPSLAPDDFQAIGRLAVKWSHLEFIIGNCLKALLHLTDDEAVIVVFPLSTEVRLQKIQQLVKVNPPNEKGQEALDALIPAIAALQFVRNHVIHGVINEDAGNLIFLSKSKSNGLTKAEALSIEELMNYAAHAVYALRSALGIEGFENVSFELPERPLIPEFLLKQFLRVNNGYRQWEFSGTPS
jgi:hypothetical protein